MKIVTLIFVFVVWLIYRINGQNEAMKDRLAGCINIPQKECNSSERKRDTEEPCFLKFNSNKFKTTFSKYDLYLFNGPHPECACQQNTTECKNNFYYISIEYASNPIQPFPLLLKDAARNPLDVAKILTISSFYWEVIEIVIETTNSSNLAYCRVDLETFKNYTLYSASALSISCTLFELPLPRENSTYEPGLEKEIPTMCFHFASLNFTRTIRLFHNELKPHVLTIYTRDCHECPECHPHGKSNPNGLQSFTKIEDYILGKHPDDKVCIVGVQINSKTPSQHIHCIKPYWNHFKSTCVANFLFNYYLEVPSDGAFSPNETITENECKPCHPNCASCTSYGNSVIINMCKCNNDSQEISVNGTYHCIKKDIPKKSEINETLHTIPTSHHVQPDEKAPHSQFVTIL
uniref:Uncharacterized protein n=1 Tax=Acrobeloides nanus TaxID=290746 RepID=A0A914CEK9_9BILA